MKDPAVTEAFIKIMDKVEKLAEKIGATLRRQVQDTLKENDKNVQGDLSRSINYKVERETDRIIITVLSSNLKYAPWVHEGTRAHFPPLEPIAKWVQRRGIGQSFSIKSHKMVGTKKKLVQHKAGRGEIISSGRYSKEVRNIAYLIARSISKKGTKGLKFFDLALKAAESDINDKIASFKV